MKDPVYFVHISDTHIGPTADYARHGYRPLPHALKLVDLINNLPQKPDFVIHTGDVVTEPDPDSYQIAASVFAQLKVPIYYVTGNHDRSRDIKKYLPMGPKTDLTDDPDLLSYLFTVRDDRFLVVDSRAPDELDPQGIITQAQFKILEEEIRTQTAFFTVFVHHPTWAMNSEWMDKNMLLLNGEKFHKTLKGGRYRLRGVFHGHIHQHMQTIHSGIVYTSVASTFAQFAAWPDDQEAREVPDPPGFNFVHLLPDQMLVHQHTFERPE
ncbi:MAG: metallophosphoesterase [Anaerolineales bacterium]|nr:metallophosphoesterase [Anaerolineales bacterium]